MAPVETPIHSEPADEPVSTWLGRLRGDDIFYRSTFLQSVTPSALVWVNGTIIEANNSLCHLLACEMQSLKGHSLAEFLDPVCQNVVLSALEEILNGRKDVFVGDMRICRKSSSTIVRTWIWTELTVSAAVDSRNNPVCLIVQFRDISSERAADEQLRKSENKYRTLVEMSHDLIWSVDADGRWTFLNRMATRRIYGWEPEDMLGRKFTDFMTTEQAHRDMEVFKSILEGRQYFAYRTQHLNSSGQLVDLSFNATVLRDESGTLLGTTGTAKDITHLKTFR